MTDGSNDSDVSEDGVGVRLQSARERLGMSVTKAAERLHLDPAVVLALESENFGDLGAAVYVRGHLRHYAELVKESAPQLLALYNAAVQAGPPPDLTLMPHVRPANSLRGALVVTGLVVVIGVGLIGSIHWINLDLHPAATAAIASLPTAVSAPLAAPSIDTPPGPVSAPATATAPAAAGSAVPASAPAVVHTPKPPRTPVAEASVTLKFRSACWTEVYDAHGRQLYRAIGAAGDVANLQGPAPLRVIIGNYVEVDVEINDRRQAIPAEAQAGRKAEFLVTQQGELTPVRIVTTAGIKP